jgi:hexosaminidase
MWGEWIPQVEDMYRMIYPYWAAHAETGWTDNKRKNYNRFVRSMDYFLTRWIDKNYINSHNIGIKQHQ